MVFKYLSLQMNLSGQTLALCLVSLWMMVSQSDNTDHRFFVQKFMQPAKIIMTLPSSVIKMSKDSICTFIVLKYFYLDDSDSAGQRPRSRSVQGSPQLSPMRSLGAEYDVERSPAGNHHKNHSRWEADCSKLFSLFAYKI